jgi:hypothetical protein
MRQLTKLEIERIKILTENSVEVTLIEPTKTGLEKSIMDATGPVRSYFKTKGIHNYETQKQGTENKIIIKSYLVGRDRLIDHKLLYTGLLLKRATQEYGLKH